MDVVFASKEVRSQSTKADVLALLLLKRVARYSVGHREITISYPYQSNPSQIKCYTDADWAGDVTTRLSTTAGALMHGAHLALGMVSNTESQGLVVRRVGVLCTRIWSSKRLIDETHLSRSWIGNENTCTPL